MLLGGTRHVLDENCARLVQVTPDPPSMLATQWHWRFTQLVEKAAAPLYREVPCDVLGILEASPPQDEFRKISTKI